jgi:hypothetical protein
MRQLCFTGIKLHMIGGTPVLRRPQENAVIIRGDMVENILCHQQGPKAELRGTPESAVERGEIPPEK